jgi:hypothetical protein
MSNTTEVPEMSDVQTAAIDHEVQALSRITDRPNLVALAYSLRHPETWPADFVWDYRNCTTCAIGLSLRLWPKLQLPDGQMAQQTWIAREMAMPYEAAKRMFFSLGPPKRVREGWFRAPHWIADQSAVTPDDVANAIDRYLAAPSLPPR